MNSNYTISATFPIETGKGKVDVPNGNATKKIENAVKRNKLYGYVEIKATNNKNYKEVKEVEEGR